jgi:hypothetical protein
VLYSQERQETHPIFGERKKHARRWTGSDLRGYPTLAAEDETEETLAAEPPKRDEREAKKAEE